MLMIPSLLVREHHAPVGALRHNGLHDRPPLLAVREHHAPVGALRRSTRHLVSQEGYFRGGFEDVGREGRGGGLLGRVLLVRRVVARASECVSRV